MNHINSDGDTDYDGEDAVASRRNTAAVTPLSAGLGSPLPVSSWTGGLPTHSITDGGPKSNQTRGRQREQKSKPSWIEMNGTAPSKHKQENVSTNAVASNTSNQQSNLCFESSPIEDATDEISDLFNQPSKSAKKLSQKASQKASQKDYPPDVVDSTYPQDDRFSDPKDASPTPRPRAAVLQDGRRKDDSVSRDQKKKKKKGFLNVSSTAASFASQPTDSPRDAKLTDAMRGTSLAPTQGNSKNATSKVKAQRNRAATTRPKMSALDLEDPESADCNSMFDTVNMPLSQGNSPGATKKSSKAATRPAPFKSTRPRSRPSKEIPKSQAQAKPPAPAKQNKTKKREPNSHQDGDNVANDAVMRNKNDGLPQPAHQTRRGKVPAKQEPVTISSGSDTDDAAGPEPSTDDEDGEYIEKGQRQRLGTSSQPSKTSKTSQRGKTMSNQGSEPAKKLAAKKEAPRTQARSRDPASAVPPKKGSSVETADSAIDDNGEMQPSRPAAEGSKRSNAAVSNPPERNMTNSEKEVSLGEAKPCVPLARKPTIIPFDASGPKANGVSRTKAGSKAPKKAGESSTDALEDNNGARSLDSNVTPQNAHPHKPKDCRKIEHDMSEANASETQGDMERAIGTSAVKELSTSSEAQENTQRESHSSALGANDNDAASDCPILEDTPPSGNHANERDDDGPVFMVDNDPVDETAEPSHNVDVEGLAVPHYDQNEPSVDDGHCNGPDMARLDKSIQCDSSIAGQGRTKRSLTPDEYVNPSPAVEQPTFPKSSAQTTQRLGQRSFQQTAEDFMERPAKKQRLDEMIVAPVLNSSFPRNDQKDLMVSAKQRDGDIAGERRRREFEKIKAPLRHLTSVDSDLTLGANSSRVYQHGFVKVQSENKFATKRDIAQQFLADMANRSNALDREAAFEDVPEEHSAEPVKNLQCSDGHAGHRKRALVQNISERECAFEENPATPDQALAAVMHRIVGVSLAFCIFFFFAYDCDADHLEGYTSTNEGKRILSSRCRGRLRDGRAGSCPSDCQVARQ